MVEWWTSLVTTEKKIIMSDLIEYIQCRSAKNERKKKYARNESASEFFFFRFQFRFNWVTVSESWIISSTINFVARDCVRVMRQNVRLRANRLRKNVPLWLWECVRVCVCGCVRAIPADEEVIFRKKTTNEFHLNTWILIAAFVQWDICARGERAPRAERSQWTWYLNQSLSDKPTIQRHSIFVHRFFSSVFSLLEIERAACQCQSAVNESRVRIRFFPSSNSKRARSACAHFPCLFSMLSHFNEFQTSLGRLENCSFSLTHAVVEATRVTQQISVNNAAAIGFVRVSKPLSPQKADVIRCI